MHNRIRQSNMSASFWILLHFIFRRLHYHEIMIVLKGLLLDGNFEINIFRAE